MEQSGTQLRKVQSLLPELLEHLPDAMLVVDEHSRILVANAQARKLFGYEREELEGQRLDILVPDRFRGRHSVHHTVFFANPQVRPMGAGLELFGLHKNGSEFPVEISLSPLTTDEGVLVFSAVRDISERKELEQKLNQAQKMEAFGQLAGGVAHDFNNRLNVILGFCALLLEDIGSDEPQRGRIKEIKKAGERAASLVQQLLAFSRKQRLDLRATSLSDVLRNIETMLRRTIGEDIELEIFTNPSLGAVRVDSVQMEHVILNLVVNARDAMPRGGQLIVETSNVTLGEEYCRTHAFCSPGEYVMLAVSDTGTGMDEATKKRIFEPFFTTKEAGKGTGLGLATVYGVVKQSGGHIYVYSEQDRGTTFKIYFPRVDDMPDAPGAAAATQEETRGRETILVVEDDEASCALLCEYLMKRGYTVLEAYTGNEAMQIAERHPGPIALAITDVVMPGMSGSELAETLKASRRLIKVLFVSGYTQNVMAHHGVLNHEIEFLQKPYNLPEVARKLRSLLR
jgi:two-component system, cell cycle sensor histidine kinase and response regulator CckA